MKFVLIQCLIIAAALSVVSAGYYDPTHFQGFRVEENRFRVSCVQSQIKPGYISIPDVFTTIANYFSVSPLLLQLSFHKFCLEGVSRQGDYVPTPLRISNVLNLQDLTNSTTTVRSFPRDNSREQLCYEFPGMESNLRFDYDYFSQFHTNSYLFQVSGQSTCYIDGFYKVEPLPKRK